MVFKLVVFFVTVSGLYKIIHYVNMHEYSVHELITLIDKLRSYRLIPDIVTVSQYFCRPVSRPRQHGGRG